MRRDDYWGFIPRRIGAVETAPQRMEALRAEHFTPTSRVYPTYMFTCLEPWIYPPARRIGAVETAPQRMEALRAEHLTPTSRVYPTYMP